MPCRTWQTYTQGYGLWQVWTTVLQRTAPPFKYCSRSCRANSNACSRAASPACRAAATTRVHWVCVCMCVSSNLQLQCKYKNTNAAYIYTQMHMYVYTAVICNLHACCFSLSPFLTPCVCLHTPLHRHTGLLWSKKAASWTSPLSFSRRRYWPTLKCAVGCPNLSSTVNGSSRQSSSRRQQSSSARARTPPPLPHTHHCAPVQVALELVAQKRLATASCGGNRGHGHDNSSGAQANITQQQQQHNIAQQHRAYASVSAMPNQILQPLTQANEDDSETLLLQSDALALDVAADEDLVRICGRARSGCCWRAFAPPPTHIQRGQAGCRCAG